VSERIYLVPGFFGFTNLGELRYFGHVHRFLAEACARVGLDAQVHSVRTPPTSSLRTRAARLLDAIAATLRPGDGPIHLIGHSSGGLDVRLLLSPEVSLPTRVDPERIVARVRTVVTVSAPHHGTPVASFFASLLGQRLLQLLSLSTIYVLRFGHPPIAVLLKLGAAFARLDRHLGVNSALLDQLFGQLLGDFSTRRRRVIGRLLEDVRTDQALLTQLTPEGMDLFNASTRMRRGVRYGCVVTRAHPPGVRSAMAAGLDPSAQASHAVYQGLYRLAARASGLALPSVTRSQARVLERSYGEEPGPAANDGLVPTLSQVWGDVIHAARADHLDVVGHFDDPAHDPPHFDWLSTGTGFTRRDFEAVWSDVARYVRAGAGGRASASGQIARRQRTAP
jgi:triacylglycerol esterase/lipase EstA (alpha/beta hydrolase family)